MVRTQTLVTKNPQETARLGETLGCYLKAGPAAPLPPVGTRIPRLLLPKLFPKKEGCVPPGPFRRVTRQKRGEGSTVLCLYGELGSGKTTFVQGLAKGLGIKARLLSPTFIIVRRYEIPQYSGFLYHVDLYRVQNEADIAALGFSEILTDPDSIVVVEWAEKLGRLLPRRRIDIHFSIPFNDKREIVLEDIG